MRGRSHGCGRLRMCPSSARRREAGAIGASLWRSCRRAFNQERPTLDGLSDLRGEGPSRSQLRRAAFAILLSRTAAPCRRPLRSWPSATNAEALDQGLVARLVALLDVV